MRLATTYAEPGGWYYEFCTLDGLQAAACIYPDVGCIHQGYNIKAERKDAKGALLTPLTEPEARAEALALAVPFLEQERARSFPIWEGARIKKERERVQKELQMRAEAKDKALAEKMLAEERAKPKPVP